MKSKYRLLLQIVFFALVGTIGFVVDAGILEIMFFYLHVDPYVSRLISFLAAATVTWLLNRILTFKSKNRMSLREWWVYVMFMGVGAVLNLGVYTVVVFWYGTTQMVLLSALAAGTMSGMGINFFSARCILSKPAIINH
jgi:putative flippase GtrA